MRTDRRSPDVSIDKDAEADIAELDQLIAEATPSVVQESTKMVSSVRARASEARSLVAMRDAITNGLHELDLAAGTQITAGVIVAAAAMGVAHANEQRVVGWPSHDGIVAREYWQRVAGWTDEEYAAVAHQARGYALQAHSAVVLEHAHRAADHVEHAIHAMSHGQPHGNHGGTPAGHPSGGHGVWPGVQHTLHEVELLGEITNTMREDELHMATHRASLIADAEPSAAYALQKYSAQLGLAEDDDVLVYVTKDDGKVRPNHRALHMKAWPAKSPVWRRIYPPNGLHCRCTVVRRSRAWASTNLKPEAIRTTVPKGGGPDMGFSRDPRARRRTDTSKYRPAHVSALAGATR